MPGTWKVWREPSACRPASAATRTTPATTARPTPADCSAASRFFRWRTTLPGPAFSGPGGGGSLSPDRLRPSLLRLRPSHQLGEPENEVNGNLLLREAAVEEAQGDEGALGGVEIAEGVLGGADEGPGLERLSLAQGQRGEIDRHVGGLVREARVFKSLIGGFEEALGEDRPVEGGGDSALQPDEVEALRLARRKEAIPMRFQETLSFARTPALHLEPEQVVEGVQHEVRVALLVEQVQALASETQGLPRPAGVARLETLGDERPAFQVLVAAVALNVHDHVQGDERTVVAPAGGFERGLKVKEARLEQ